MTRSPVEWVIFVFGGQSEVARALNVSQGAVSQWKIRGNVPDKQKPKLLELARVRGLDLNANDLIVGRKLDAKA